MNNFSIRLLHPNGGMIEFHGPADITRETTEAIVNAANSSLIGGGGVDGAIHRAGGPSILTECLRIVAENGRLPPGHAVITGGGRLAAKYVIHTVGPIYQDGSAGEADTLASCYRESIRLAHERSISSVAFPSISTGAYGYPLAEAALVAVGAVADALAPFSGVRIVRFILFGTPELNAYGRAAEELARTPSESKYRIEKRGQ